ncbi:carcinoembryonic antigen-related cell adhesion molecule 1-like [Pomacea canaliculata]|uniref:carcinoembryonic antigen-related cell adhesion molecule 1-like n=1 Tax=Pomacea canaliculata TaxID=400727 RepID=UPI000D72F302|nr:carcinoembryonic antigen-related cell adhesion molecule 1-like [Pomacea canaliculata]
MVTANGVKSDFSQPLTLTVKPLTPTVTAESSLPVPEGGNVSITCRTASEKLMTAIAAFTFYDPSDVIVAANVSNKTFTLTSMTLARAGNYKCKVIYDRVSSDVSTTPLLVTVKPAQPTAQTTAVLPVEEGQSLTLSCQTSSTMPAGGVVAYSWRQPGGSVIAGAVSATYTLSDVNFAKAGGYQCQVSYNALPSDYSAVLTVTVKPATPSLSGLSAGQASSSLSLTCSSPLWTSLSW